MVRDHVLAQEVALTSLALCHMIQLPPQLQPSSLTDTADLEARRSQLEEILLCCSQAQTYQ